MNILSRVKYIQPNQQWAFDHSWMHSDTEMIGYVSDIVLIKFGSFTLRSAVSWCIKDTSNVRKYSIFTVTEK